MMNIKTSVKLLAFRRNLEVTCLRTYGVHSSVTESNLKTLSDVPGPLKLPLIGNAYLLPLYWSRIQEANLEWDKSFKKYGPIYREKLGTYEIVHIRNVNDVEKIFRHEGKYPKRISIEPWKNWREARGLPKGVLVEEGAQWKRLRKYFDRPMMTTKYLSMYIASLRSIADDFLDGIERKSSANDGLVPNIDNDLFRWSLENISSVLYEARLGALSDNITKEATQFVSAVENVFISTAKIFYTPRAFNKIFIRKWQKLHDDSWDVVFDYTAKLIKIKMKDIEQKTLRGDEVTGFLGYLVSTELSFDEICGSASEIMFAAVDTTSMTMQWILYELANHPDIQQELYQEVVSNPEIRSMDDLSKLPLLKAYVKEILRMYPVALIASRVLQEETEIAGYLLPKDTTIMANMFLIGRSEENYEDASLFKPHRWLRGRKDPGASIHSFAWLPFGFGQRACIGRKLAELEIYNLLSKVVRRFTVEKAEMEPNWPTIKGLLVPSRTVNVRFKRRA